MPEQKKVYIIVDVGKTIEDVRSICNIPDNIELILIHSINDIPFADRNSEVIENIRSITEFNLIPPKYTELFIEKKPKNHIRSYKYHK